MHLTACDIHVVLGFIGGLLVGAPLAVLLMEIPYWRRAYLTLNLIPESMILRRAEEIEMRNARKMWRSRTDARRRNRKPQRR